MTHCVTPQLPGRDFPLLPLPLFLLNFILFYFGVGWEMGGVGRHAVKDTKD